MRPKLKKMYLDFQDGKINNVTMINHINSILTQSYDLETRIDCIKILGKETLKSKLVFEILENLLISDKIEKIRKLCAEILGRDYYEEAFKALKFSYLRDPSLDVQLSILSILAEKEDKSSRNFFINEIDRNIYQDYFRDPSDFKTKNLSNFAISYLFEVLKNYQILENLKTKISNIDYSSKNGVIRRFCLSDLNLKSHRGSFLLNNFLKYVGSFKNLEKLALKNSTLKDIGKHIKNLKCLNKIDLKKNSITNLSDDFCSLRRLRWINLDYNKLTSLNPNFGNLANLRYLSVRHNKLDNLPNSFVKLKQLKHLDLYCNQFEQFPREIEGLYNLTHLNFGLNKLLTIPPWINKLKKLRTLGLGGNKKLRDLLDGITCLKNLEGLYLFDLNLNEFPEVIGELENLKYLSLNNNQISNIPDFILNLRSLREIDLSWNNFKLFPDIIFKFQNLKKINLEGNKIKEIPKNLSNFKKNREINLRFNK